MTSLKSWNTWGIVTVKGSSITVVLAAASTDGRLVKRTLKREAAHRLAIEATASVALDVRAKGYDIAVQELGETAIASHPDVLDVIQDAVEWLRKNTD